MPLLEKLIPILDELKIRDYLHEQHAGCAEPVLASDRFNIVIGFLEKGNLEGLIKWQDSEGYKVRPDTWQILAEAQAKIGMMIRDPKLSEEKEKLVVQAYGLLKALEDIRPNFIGELFNEALARHGEGYERDEAVRNVATASLMASRTAKAVLYATKLRGDGRG